MTKGPARLVVAGVQSGVGKTSVTLGLVRALARQGLRVQTYKVGPDYLDPTHLAQASGTPCYNLDGWMMGREYVQDLFVRTARDADLAVIEGVMGLFDGVSPESLDGSTAEIAAWLQAPVLLVADARGMSRSLAALVQGYAGFEPRVRLAGVIANHCGSERHVAGLRRALETAGMPPLLGAIERGAFPELPSRHLGLVTADPRNTDTTALTALADAVEASMCLDSVLTLSRAVVPLTAPPPRTCARSRLRIGVACDEAFHFYYQDCLDELSARACEVVRFSPLRDSELPTGLAALYFGGGYPEEHAAALAANVGMREAIRTFVAGDRAVYAECGGLMYLAESLQTLDGAIYPMAGVLPVGTRMLPRRKLLGYMEATVTDDCLLGVSGSTFRGHEYHYSELTGESPWTDDWSPAYLARRPGQPGARPEGFRRGNVLASYVHLPLGAHCAALEHFLTICGGLL